MLKLPDNVLKSMSKEDLIEHIHQLYRITNDQEDAIMNKNFYTKELRHSVSSLVDCYEADIRYLMTLHGYNQDIHKFEHDYEECMPKCEKAINEEINPFKIRRNDIYAR